MSSETVNDVVNRWERFIKLALYIMAAWLPVFVEQLQSIDKEFAAYTGKDWLLLFVVPTSTTALVVRAYISSGWDKKEEPENA